MYPPNSITVLTIPERADLYRSVLGEEIDLKYNPQFTNPLDGFLKRVTICYGTLAVIDEAHFYNTQSLYEDIKKYVDNPLNSNHQLRLIFVCSERKPGDNFLAFLTTYCNFYDVVYNVEGIDISLKVKNLIDRPNKRYDVLELMHPYSHVNDMLAGDVAQTDNNIFESKTISKENISRHDATNITSHSMLAEDTIRPLSRESSFLNDDISIHKSVSKENGNITVNIQITIPKDI